MEQRAKTKRVAERQKKFRKFCLGLFFHTFKLYTKSLLIFVFFGLLFKGDIHIFNMYNYPNLTCITLFLKRKNTKILRLQVRLLLQLFIIFF